MNLLKTSNIWEKKICAKSGKNYFYACFGTGASEEGRVLINLYRSTYKEKERSSISMKFVYKRIEMIRKKVAIVCKPKVSRR